MSKWRRIRNRALALSLGCVFALLAAEVALRILLDPKPEELEPRVQFQRYDVDPNIGRTARYWLVREEMRGTNGFSFDAPVRVNRLGMRGADPRVPRQPGSLRVVAVGDSMTFGVGVADEQTWPAQLEQRLRARLAPRFVEVLNAGMPGLNIEQEVSLFLEHVVPLEPDIVIVGYYWNDMPELADPMLPWAEDDVVHVDSMVPLAPSSDRNKSRVDRQSPWIEGLKNVLRSSYLLHFVAQKVPAVQHAFLPSTVTLWKRAVLENAESERIDRSWGFVRDQLTEIRSAAHAHGFELLLVPLPIFEQIVASATPDTSGYQGRIASIAAALEIPTVDPIDAIRSITPSYPADFVPFDGHPTGRIYGAVADVIAERLHRDPPASRAR